MLRSLSIQNYALIHQLQINFNEGFTIITGETGSGKSILLGALSLVLGHRPEANVLRDSDKKCVIEGVFDIQSYNLEGFFEEQDLDYDSQTVIRREIHPSGKSRAFINDTPVNIRLLKELGTSLIDIHSQNQNLLLGDSAFQLRVVDAFAQNRELLDEYQKHYFLYSQFYAELRELIKEEEKAKADLDYYQFQFNQLNEAQLRVDEQQEMEKELEYLNHSEEIKSNLYKACGLLSDDNMSVLSNVKEIEGALGQLTRVYEPAQELYQRIESVYIELQDLAGELERKNESVEYDPERIEYLNKRLDMIYSLQQKHRVNKVEELLQIQDQLGQKIERISSGDEVIEQMREKVAEKERLLNELSGRLNQGRINVIPQIEIAIMKQLQQLGMPNVKLKVELETLDSFDVSGKDYVVFLFSANKNGMLQEIPKVASGGEMSRVMLSIKSLISEYTALPSIVFDEIDAGVSGEIADKMGVMMKRMSNNIQVISITHLPQIASKGKHHYKVYKADDELKTYSNIIALDPEQRVEELAKMLSGSDLIDAAFENARALLKN